MNRAFPFVVTRQTAPRLESVTHSAPPALAISFGRRELRAQRELGDLPLAGGLGRAGGEPARATPRPAAALSVRCRVNPPDGFQGGQMPCIAYLFPAADVP